jgi:hypothetical protein
MTRGAWPEVMEAVEWPKATEAVDGRDETQRRWRAPVLFVDTDAIDLCA